MTGPAPLNVGVLGGMGPAATIDLMARVLRLSPREREQDGIRLIVDSNPAIPDRNDAILRGGPSPGPVLGAMAQGLEAAGADFVVMACNTAHAFQFDIERVLRVPFVSIVEEAARMAAREAPGGTVGLLAAEGCLAAGLYQTELARRSLSCVTLDPAGMTEFMNLLYAIKSGDLSADISRRMGALAADLQSQGAGAIVAACTEVPLVLRADAVAAPLIDATEVLALAIIDYATGVRELPPVFAMTDSGSA